MPFPAGRVRILAAVLVAAASAAAVAGALAIGHGSTRGQTATIALASIVAGYAFVLAGGYALTWRRDKSTGALMNLAGFLLLAASMEQANRALPFTVGNALAGLPAVVIAHVILGFPDGRLHSRWERLAIGLGYLDATVLQVTMLMFMGPEQFTGCPCPRNLLLVADDGTVHMQIMGTQQRLSTALTVWVLGLLLRRWIHSSAPLRRATTPVLAAGALCAGLLGLSQLGAGMPTWLRIGLASASRVALIAIPAAYWLGLVRARLDRAAVGRLMLELDGMTGPGQLREALSRALGDRSLELAYWTPERACYVDAHGAAFALPHTPDRATSVLERNGRPVAVLVHDPALAQNRPLLDEVAAAAGLALENESLHADLRAQLAAVNDLAAELRASRARIVEAGDLARRKLERNLHDGAQQQIVTVAVSLAHAEQVVRRDPDEAARLIAAARSELTSALQELRELARGLHPAILNRGLRPALKSLVERSSVPVHLHAGTVDGLPITVAATAYYVVAEALTNAVRYSGATAATVDVATSDGWLDVEIHDDGCGGACLGRGSGLEGLRDRVDAVGGRFELVSPAGSGTRLCARLPLQS